jgi:hypothetical protein
MAIFDHFGIQLLEVARQRWPGVPFVMMTGNDTEFQNAIDHIQAIAKFAGDDKTACRNHTFGCGRSPGRQVHELGSRPVSRLEHDRGQSHERKLSGLGVVP